MLKPISPRSIRSVPIRNLLLMLSLILLTACAAQPVPALIIAPSLREPCSGADITKVKTINDIASFAVEDDAALVLCESKRKALVELVDSAKSEVKK